MKEYVCRECGKASGDLKVFSTRTTHGTRRICVECDRARLRRRKAANAKFIASSKDKPCLDCGVSYPPYVMEYDHLDASVKVGNLSQMKSASRRAIIREIGKCDVVCANCHRERTYQRMIAGNSRRASVPECAASRAVHVQLTLEIE